MDVIGRSASFEGESFRRDIAGFFFVNFILQFFTNKHTANSQTQTQLEMYPSTLKALR